MTFKELNKDEVVRQAQDLFLNKFPLREIENPEVRLICQSYRNDNCSIDSCRQLFKKHYEYFYKWAYNNWLTDVFYFQK
jgi:hypothetical protein